MELSAEVISFISQMVLGLGSIAFFFGILVGLCGGIWLCNFIIDMLEIPKLTYSKIKAKILEKRVGGEKK